MAKKSKREQAEYYVKKMKFSIIPLYPNAKIANADLLPIKVDEKGKPVLDEDGKPKKTWKPYQDRMPTKKELDKWFPKGSRNNIGIITGSISRLAVNDLDGKKGVMHSKDNNYFNTVVVKTGGKGRYHLYFQIPEGITVYSHKIPSLEMEIKGEGGYVVAPPSIHESGKQYEFVKGKSFNDIELAEFPTALLKQHSKAKKSAVEGCYRRVKKGDRNSSLTKAAGSLFSDGLELNRALDLLLAVNTKYNPPLPVSEVKKIASSIYTREKQKAKTNKSFLPEIITASNLEKLEFPELSYIVNDVITEGLTLTSGKPKTGKSFFALNIAVAVATGRKALGQLATEKGGVLYLALEDTQRGLQRRLKKILQGKRFPSKLYLATECPKVQEGGLDVINNLLDKHPNVKLLIIDTLQRVRQKPSRNQKVTLYAEDYEAIACFKKISDSRNISILMIHHSRKTDSDDPIDMISGTTGLAGAADNILMLKKYPNSDEAELFISGRNIEQKSLALKFDTNNLSWISLGEAKEHRTSDERQEILELLKDIPDPMKPKQIAEALNKKAGSIKFLLHKMAKNHEVKRVGWGLYTTNFANDSNNEKVSKVSGSCKATKHKSKKRNLKDVSKDSDDSIDDLV